MTEGQSGATLDRVARWLALVLAALGVAAYTIGLVTELDRIARDFWEDGIVLGFCYSWLTAVGVLRSFKPHLPRGLHVASALANALVGYVLIMFWVGLFTGQVDRGAELVPVLMTIAYLVIMRAIRISEHFRPPLWLTVGVVLFTALNFVIPEVLQQRSHTLSDLNTAATISGVMQTATVLGWIGFVITGFRRTAEAPLSREISPRSIKDQLPSEPREDIMLSSSAVALSDASAQDGSQAQHYRPQIEHLNERDRRSKQYEQWVSDGCCGTCGAKLGSWERLVLGNACRRHW